MPTYEVILKRKVTIVETARVKVKADDKTEAEIKALTEQDKNLDWNEEDVDEAEIESADVKSVTETDE